MAWLDVAPRRVLALVAAGCVAMLAFGLYLQHGVGLNPCPMCIVQRYALIGVTVLSAGGAWISRRGGWLAASALGVLLAGFGAFVAARQSWLQWHPPELVSCGRDFYGMIATFPLERAIPMIFRGGGDCAAVDWTFLGGSIANWSFLCFVGIAIVLSALVWRQFRQAPDTASQA